MIFIWQEILFKPLLNLLIGLYNSIGIENLGLAVVWLTVIVRLILLPISLKHERSKLKERDLREELQVIKRSFQNNPSMLRQEQRNLLKKHNFRRWPKVISLAVQGIILVVLYQVFLGGINVTKIVDQLYSWVDVPFQINTIFLGVDIAQRSFIFSFLCGVLLFVNIWLGYRRDNKKWHSQDLLYAFGFPAATTLILWYLPSVKAVFIFSSMVFSSIIRASSAFRTSVKGQKKSIIEQFETEAKSKEKGLPQVKDRFS